LALIAKIVDHVSSMENMHMIQRNNSPTRRLVAARRVALLASVAGAGIAVLAGGPDLYTASNPSTWISSAAAADIHGWMGVRIQPVTADIADSLGLKKAEGALVAEPQSGSPAAKAGILAGDVITAVDGKDVKDPGDLARKISATAPGTDVKLTIQRKGEEKTVSVTLGQQPEQRQGDTGTDRRVMPDGTPRLGLTLAPASDVGGAGDQGVAVTSVDPNGPAAEHGIKTGDVILEVAGQAVSKPEDVRQQLANLQKDGKHTLLMRVKSGDTTTFVAVRLGKA
jgi:serine protease Do